MSVSLVSLVSVAQNSKINRFRVCLTCPTFVSLVSLAQKQPNWPVLCLSHLSHLSQPPPVFGHALDAVCLKKRSKNTQNRPSWTAPKKWQNLHIFFDAAPAPTRRTLPGPEMTAWPYDPYDSCDSASLALKPQPESYESYGSYGSYGNTDGLALRKCTPTRQPAWHRSLCLALKQPAEPSRPLLRLFGEERRLHATCTWPPLFSGPFHASCACRTCLA